ncbi:hypothetical protein KIH24_14260 [Rhizobiales bacterium TNE-4]|nr:hypothetical protein [Rhizobiales bacterium TNE-4]MBV1828783.1 hypothetical protein [Rhizobiales bacterium TNE-4]
MSDEEPYKHRQIDTRKSGANEPTARPNLIAVLREDLIRDLQDQLRLARLYLSVPDPSPKDYQKDRPLPDPWWIMRPDGNLLFVIYCLNKPVEIQPGVAAILIEGRENLILAIKALINIIRAGRLDRALVHT